MTTRSAASRSLLSVVVPAYNESRRIAATVRQIAAYLAERGLAGEIIVVDDGSRDGTAKEAEAAPHRDSLLRVLRVSSNRGKGHAVKCGVLDAAGDVILFTDVDLSVPIRELDKFLSAIDTGAQIVIGSRRLGGSPLRRWAPGFLRVPYRSQIKIHQPLWREVCGEAYHGLVRRFLRVEVMDTNCGFKCFRADVAKRLFRLLTVERWGFDAEILLAAKRHGIRVVELEVEWSNRPSSRVNALTAPFSSLLEVLRIKVNDLLGTYRPTDPAAGTRRRRR